MDQEACPTQTNVTSLSFLVLQVNYFIQESLKQRYVAVVRKTSARILSLIPMSPVILKSNIYIYIQLLCLPLTWLFSRQSFTSRGRSNALCGNRTEKLGSSCRRCLSILNHICLEREREMSSIVSDDY